MKIKKTCSYHENMTFVPVVVQIVDLQLQQIFGASYIL